MGLTGADHGVGLVRVEDAPAPATVRGLRNV